MARSTRKSNAPKTDNYQAVTDAIVEALERGVAPWVCPWDKAAGLPHNGHSGHVYRGINTWLAWASGHTDPRWFTFKQVQEYGESHVRKGEKGTKVVFWRFVDKDEEQEDGTTKTRSIPFLKVYTVFNFNQIEWDTEHMPKGVELRDHDPEAENAEAAAFVEALGADIRHGGTRACYSPSADTVDMPLPGTFETTDGYWSTLFHELTHWSGHKDRCGRDLSGRFGDASYAMEELVAELGSAFLCGDMGVKGQLQHAEYIGAWIKVLKNDKHAIFSAQARAREAAEWMVETAAKATTKAHAA